MESKIIQLTELENHFLISFANGSNIKILMPHLIRSFFQDIDYPTINQLLTFLSIKCCQCTPEQLRILHTTKILSSDVNQCGLIDKVDAKRLCKFIHNTNLTSIRSTSSLFVIPIIHYCFGRQQAFLYPDLYVKSNSRCIKCASCSQIFTTCEFVKHTHLKINHINTVHWGFHSLNWRYFIYIYIFNADVEYHKNATLILDNIKSAFLKEDMKKMKNKLPWRPKNLRINIPPISTNKVNSIFQEMKPIFKRKDVIRSNTDQITFIPNVYIDSKDNLSCDSLTDSVLDDDDDEYEDLSNKESKLNSLANISEERLNILQKINEYKRIISTEKSKNYLGRHSTKFCNRKFQPKYINSILLSRFQKNESEKMETEIGPSTNKCTYEMSFHIRNQLHKSVFEKLNYLMQITEQRKQRKSSR